MADGRDLHAELGTLLGNIVNLVRDFQAAALHTTPPPAQAAELVPVEARGELPPYIYGREAGPNEKVWTEATVRAVLAASRAVQAPEQREWETPPASWRLLAKAAIDVLCAIDEKHDNKAPPMKYSVPYGAVNALRAALGAATPSTPAASSEDARDAARLDWLQQRGATVEILPGGPGLNWEFRVGGLYCSVGHSIRKAIDAAIAATPEAPK